MLKRFLANREYDLPWDRKFHESITVVIVALFIPYSIKYPIAAVYAIGVIVYYSLISPRINRLGIILNLGTRRTLIFMSVIFITLNVFMFVVIQEMKYEAHMGNDQKMLITDMSESNHYKEFEPDYRFEQAILTGSPSLSLLFQNWKHIVLFGIWAPIYESVFIFGILFPVSWKQYSYRRSILITVVVFMFMHFNMLNIVAIFEYALFTMVSIWLYTKTKSLLPLILFHSVTNLTKSAITVYINWELQTVYTNLLR